MAGKKSTCWIIWVPGKHGHFMSFFDKAGDKVIDAEILRPKILRHYENTHIKTPKLYEGSTLPRRRRVRVQIARGFAQPHYRPEFG